MNWNNKFEWKSSRSAQNLRRALRIRDLERVAQIYEKHAGLPKGYSMYDLVKVSLIRPLPDRVSVYERWALLVEGYKARIDYSHIMNAIRYLPEESKNAK